MPTLTGNYSFNLPSVGFDDDAWGTLLNTNFTKLDDLFTDAFVGGTPTDIGKLKGENLADTIANDHTFTGIIRLHSTAPRLEFRETDRTLPEGAWRIFLATSEFLLQRNTAVAGDFSTTSTPFKVDKDGHSTFAGNVTVSGNFSFSGQLSGGIAFVPATGATKLDSTNHIQLNGTYGINITSGALNIVVSSIGRVDFVRDNSGTPQVMASVTSAGFSGPGANITDLDASNLAAGVVPSARLNGSYTDVDDLAASGVLSGATAVRAGYGTVADPGFAFTSDPDTGFYRSASNQITVSAGGVAVADIDANGVSLRSGKVYNGNGSGLSALNASELTTGTVSTARLPTTTNARDWVHERLAEGGHNVVGAYAYLCHIGGAAISFGTTYAATNLRASGVTDGGSSADVSEGGSVSGSWQAHGFCTADSARTATLFKRVA